jgi:hypothetical protein
VDLEDLRALGAIIKAKLANRPLALCDIGDADGLTSASLFLIKYPNGVVVFAPPGKVQRGRLYRLFTWDFVADLPCPGKAIIRADHHETNKPCAKLEYYDPKAPCSALLAMRALNLAGNPIAESLVKVAIETDTARISSEEARQVDMLARFSRYGEKVRAASMLAKMGLEALKTPYVKGIVDRGIRSWEVMLKVADALGVDKVINAYFNVKLGISYRQLTIELQRRGASMVNLLVRLGYRTFRYYCGADPSSGFDCTKVATALGGGGHSYAAGAQFKAPLTRPMKGVETFINALRANLNLNGVELLMVTKDTNGFSVRRVQVA